jgi:putative ABC transport system substrate-binding protein
MADGDRSERKGGSLVPNIRRRKITTLVGGAAVAWPLTLCAQQPAIPVIGFLNAASPDSFAHIVRAFRLGLNEAGYVEDRNVTIDFRWANGQYDRLPALAAELVRRRVSVIVTGSNIVAARAAMSSTTTIPIVFLTGGSPAKDGLVASLARPGGNVTGITTLNVELVPKRFEILRELVPATTIMAALINPINDPTFVKTATGTAQAAAHALGLQMHVIRASTGPELDAAFATMIQRRVGGLVIIPDTFFSGQSAQLAALAMRHTMPTVSPYREFVEAGGMMSYGGSVTDQYRQLGVYTGRILKGEKPADLPVQQVTKVELIINLKTVKAFGLTVSNLLLGRADQVIE